MLTFKEAIELAKVTLCKNCMEVNCKHCPWTAEQAIEKIKRAVNE